MSINMSEHKSMHMCVKQRQIAAPDLVMACIFMVLIVMASTVMVCIVIAYMVLAYIVMAYLVMAYIVMACSLYAYDLYSYDLYSYGLYSCGLYVRRRQTAVVTAAAMLPILTLLKTDADADAFECALTSSDRS